MSPAQPCAPRCNWPCVKIPAPIPLPIFTKMSSFVIGSFRSACSPSAIKLTSLSTHTGTLYLVEKRSRTGNLSHPGIIGGETGSPVANSTGPGTPMPMPHKFLIFRLTTKSSNEFSTRVKTASGPSEIWTFVNVVPNKFPLRSEAATLNPVAPNSATKIAPALELKLTSLGALPPVDCPTSPL